MIWGKAGRYMLEQLIRPRYQAYLVEPIASRIKNRISPNSITVLSGILGFCVLLALMQHQILLAIMMLLASGYCDTLDGSLARMTNNTSNWGSVLDIMMDRFVEVCVVLGIFMMSPATNGLGCLIMLGSFVLCITSFLVVGIFSQNTSEKSFYYSPGLIERAETFCFFILMMIFPNLFNLLVGVLSILVVITAFIRMRQFYLQNI